MAILDQSLQGKIDDLSNQAYEKFQAGETDESFRLLKQAWNIYPDPKNQWNEAYSNAKFLFDDYLRIGDHANALEWLNKMTDHNDERHLFDNAIAFDTGKYNYETGQYQQALTNWQAAVKAAGLRYFENEKEEYLKFYNNPDSLIKS